jgi:hypothetical protein
MHVSHGKRKLLKKYNMVGLDVNYKEMLEMNKAS